MDYKRLQESISGNVVPVPGQFREQNLAVDLDKVREHTRFLLERGVGVLYLANSASQFQYMTSEERIAFTETVCREAQGRAVVLAQAVGEGWLESQIEEARKMVDVGADVIVVKPSGLKEGGKFFSCKYARGSYSPSRHDGYFIDYMERFSAAIDAGLAYHDAPFSSGSNLSLDALGQIVALDNVVCLKVHVPDPCVMQRIYETFSGQVAAYDGFGKTLQFWSLRWGATGRHTCWSWFDPDGDEDFYQAALQNDWSRAADIVDREWPVAHAIQQTGFQGYMELMRLRGLPSGPIRIPGEQLNDDQRKMLAAALEQMGLGAV